MKRYRSANDNAVDVIRGTVNIRALAGAFYGLWFLSSTLMGCWKVLCVCVLEGVMVAMGYCVLSRR